MGWFKSIFYLMLLGVVGALLVMTERGRQTLSLATIVCQNALNMLLGLCSKDASQHGYAPVSRHDDYDDEVSFRKKSTPGREFPPRVCSSLYPLPFLALSFVVEMERIERMERLNELN